MSTLNYPEEKKEEENKRRMRRRKKRRGRRRRRRKEKEKNPCFKNKSNYRDLLLEGRNIAQFSKKHCTDEDASVSRKLMLYKGMILLQGSEDI